MDNILIFLVESFIQKTDGVIPISGRYPLMPLLKISTTVRDLIRLSIVYPFDKAHRDAFRDFQREFPDILLTVLYEILRRDQIRFEENRRINKSLPAVYTNAVRQCIRDCLEKCGGKYIAAPIFQKTPKGIRRQGDSMKWEPSYTLGLKKPQKPVSKTLPVFVEAPKPQPRILMGNPGIIYSATDLLAPKDLWPK